MVISSVNTVTYNGDGINTAWPFTFPVTDDTEIRVQLNNADGTAVLIDSDYWVDLVNSTVYYPGYAPGAEPPEAEQPPKVQAGQTITVYRDIPITQEVDLGEKWPFHIIEFALDKLTMICQQIDSGTKRILDNALASMLQLAGVVVDSDKLQHITDQLNTIDEKAEEAADSATAAAISEGNALSYKNAAANSAIQADATATALTDIYNDAIDQGTIVAPAIDTTLTISGAAADAQVTGDKFDSLENTFKITDEQTFFITDKNGNAAFKIDEYGDVSFKNSDLITNPSITPIKTTFVKNVTECAFSVVDANGNIGMAILNDGTLVSKTLMQNGMQSSKDINVTSEIDHFVMYGQSWSLGADASPAIDTADNYDSIMFNGGVAPHWSSDPSPMSSFVPLAEGTGSYDLESPCSASLNMAKQLLAEENGLTTVNFANYKLMASTPGQGNTSITDLKKGTYWYNRLLLHVTNAKAIADSLGKIYRVPAVGWLQGTPNKSEINQLQIDLDEDIKAITGQTDDVKLITWELYPKGGTSTETIYDAYVKIHSMNANVICACPAYMLPHAALSGEHAIHLSNIGSIMVGAYMGAAFKRVIVDGEDFVPLSPKSATISGSTLFVKFNVPVTPLVIDTQNLRPVTDYGFSIRDTVGNRDLTISSISIIGTDTVKIVCTETILSSYKLSYLEGLYSPDTGYDPSIGIVGNLRDSQGDGIVYSKNGVSFAAHNWCVAFTETISNLEG